MDLEELREEARTQALRLKRRGITWPTAENAGPLPVPEFKATRAWLDPGAAIHERGGKWRAGGGRKGEGEVTKRATGEGKRGGGGAVYQENAKVKEGRMGREAGSVTCLTTARPLRTSGE